MAELPELKEGVKRYSVIFTDSAQVYYDATKYIIGGGLVRFILEEHSDSLLDPVTIHTKEVASVSIYNIYEIREVEG